jgi:hypothetical protein
MTQHIHTNCGLDIHGPYADDKLVKLTRGAVRADAVVAASPAVLAVPGADEDGLVTYTAAGGRWGNEISVEHLEGATGGGNEDRALQVAVSDKTITVTFGTDGGGATAPPAATALAAAIAGNVEVSKLVSATAGGTGNSASGLVAATNLAGGENDGDYLCVGPNGRFAMLINSREVS